MPAYSRRTARSAPRSPQAMTRLPGRLTPEKSTSHQPREVLSVGDLSVDTDDDLVDAGVDHRHGFLPACGVLREHEARLAPIHVVDGVAARDFGDGADGCRGCCRVDPHGDRSGDGLGGVAEVGAAGSLSSSRTATSPGPCRRARGPSGARSTSVSHQWGCGRLCSAGSSSPSKAGIRCQSSPLRTTRPPRG